MSPPPRIILAVDLLPIVEDGLVGYEFLPNQATYTYVTVGCSDRGVPVLRESSYRAKPPSTLRVAAVDGHTLSQGETDAGLRLRQRDSFFPDWSSTAEAAWTKLAALFPRRPRHCIEVHGARHECLDEALAVACAHLADSDPCIDFCGVPDEAQYGFALTHPDGGRGRLTSRQPGSWALWFQSPATTVNEEWDVSLPGIDVAAPWVRAGMTPFPPAQPVAHPLPTLPTAPSHRSRERRIGDRRDGDWLNADRRHAERRRAGSRSADGQNDNRVHEDRRRRERRAGGATQ